MSEDEGHSSGFEEDEYSTQGMSRSSPLALNRLLSRSRGSLVSVFHRNKILIRFCIDTDNLFCLYQRLHFLHHLKMIVLLRQKEMET